MNIFARDNLWRPVLLACIVFLVTGYALYLGALWLPPPQWGRELMAWCMPAVKALDSAERVGIISGRDPFPAQVVILYCALGSILLIAWCLFCFGYSHQAREMSLMPYLDQDKNGAVFRIEWLFCGVAGGMLFTFCLYVFFWFSAPRITWHDHTFHAPTLSAASLLLIGAMFLSVATAISPLGIYISLSRPSVPQKNSSS